MPQRSGASFPSEGKRKNADLSGKRWLCLAPVTMERMEVSGTMYGSYTSTDGARLSCRLLEWKNRNL